MKKKRLIQLLFVIAVFFLGTVMGFAVDLDFVAATVICIAVFHGTAGSLSETAAACLICRSSIFACHVNITL